MSWMPEHRPYYHWAQLLSCVVFGLRQVRRNRPNYDLICLFVVFLFVFVFVFVADHTLGWTISTKLFGMQFNSRHVHKFYTVLYRPCPECEPNFGSRDALFIIHIDLHVSSC